MVLLNKGFVIVAANNENTNYVSCAITLAKSIRRVMPLASITLVTNISTYTYVENIQENLKGIFDYIRVDELNRSGFELDSAIYDLSPYDHTIKLEADLYVPSSLDHWWDVLLAQPNEIVISTTIRDHRGKISDCRYYRPIIDANKLPDTYNALTYFRKGKVSKQFFELTGHIYTNWAEFRSNLRMNSNEEPATDEIYGIASAIIGEELTTLPSFKDFSMAHMKRAILNNLTDCWYDEYTVELLPYTMRINHYTQLYPVHYYHKEYCNVIESRLSKYE